MFALLIQCAWSLPLSYYVSINPDPKASSFLGEGQYSTLVYREQEPLQSEPIIPFWASALRFDRDVMIALEDDGDWGMLEIAMIKDAEDKEVWFALDSKKNGQQFIGLPNHPKAEHLASLFPLTRYRAAPQVLREGNELSVQYRRIDGADIAFRIPFRDKTRPPAKRNGHAMNHSQGDMLALLDISSLDLQPVRWETGQRRRAQKVAWKSISGVMQQTVVAMKRASWQQREREIDGVEMKSQIVDGRYCLQNDVQSYCFDQIEHERQLRYIELFQPLRGDSIAKISLNPSLPDLRFLPLEKRCSKMMVSIGTRAGYQTGKICVTPTENGVQVLIESFQPSWAKERPLLTELLMDNNRVQGNSTIMSVGGHQESVAVYPVGERKEKSVVLDAVSKNVKQPVKALSFWIGADKLQSKTLSGVPIHEIDTAWFPMNVDWDGNSALKGAHRIKVRNPDPSLRWILAVRGFQFKGLSALPLEGFSFDLQENGSEEWVDYRMTTELILAQSKLNKKNKKPYSAMARFQVVMLGFDPQKTVHVADFKGEASNTFLSVEGSILQKLKLTSSGKGRGLSFDSDAGIKTERFLGEESIFVEKRVVWSPNVHFE